VSFDRGDFPVPIIFFIWLVGSLLNTKGASVSDQVVCKLNLGLLFVRVMMLQTQSSVIYHGQVLEVCRFHLKSFSSFNPASHLRQFSLPDACGLRFQSAHKTVDITSTKIISLYKLSLTSKVTYMMACP